MVERNKNVMTGLFVFAGFVCLAILIIMFGNSRGVFGKRYSVIANFDRISGVREGTDVTLAGVWIGSVIKVGLRDPLQPSKGVEVVMDIEPRYSIPKGSKAFAMTPLMGQANVNIIPATDTSELLPQDGTGGIVGTVTGPLDQVIDPKMMDVLEATVKQIGTLADALTPAAKAVTTLLERRTVEEIDKPTTAPEKVTANLSTAVERLHKVLKHFDTVLGDPAVQSNVKDTLANFKAASEEARQAAAGLKAFGEQAQQAAAGAKGLIGKVDATMDTTHKYVNELGQRLVVSAEQISKLLTYLNSAGRDIAEGQGTVGMLLRDPKFYDELMLTVQRLGNAASELQVLVKQWQNQGLLGMAR